MSLLSCSDRGGSVRHARLNARKTDGSARGGLRGASERAKS